jgi:hypothetical protein
LPSNSGCRSNCNSKLRYITSVNADIRFSYSLEVVRRPKR